MTVSKRLETIAGLVPVGSKLADIGADHGYLSVFAVQKGIAKSVIACDINEKPLENARRTLEAEKVQNISLRLGDGFSCIEKGETDCAVIAGMGAEVIIHILSACEWIKTDTYTLLLQPMTSPEILRHWLYENGFYIETETAVSENRKLYSVMQVKYSGIKEQKDESFFYTGKLNPENSESKKYLLKQYNRFKKCADELSESEEQSDLQKFYSDTAQKIKEYIGEI